MSKNKQKKKTKIKGNKPTNLQLQTDNFSENTLLAKQNDRKSSRWQWGTVWGFLGVLAAVIAIIAGAKIAWDIQSYNDEQKIANLHYSFSIKPIPQPLRPAETTNRWETTFFVRNEGPTTAQTVVLHLNCPNPEELPHFQPVVVSNPSTATIEILARRPPGYYQVVIKNLIPGDGGMIGIYYEARESFKEELHVDWQDEMFSKEFAKRFVSSFSVTGENIRVHNEGMVELEPFFAP